MMRTNRDRTQRLAGGSLLSFALLSLTLLSLTLLACSAGPTEQPTAPPPPPNLAAHCQNVIGPEVVEQVSDRVWVARGFDLANTMLIRTSAGNVVVDASLSPSRAAKARAALLAKAPGPVKAIIFTHSHADHIGGTSAWVEPETGPVDIWATEAFAHHLFKQYGLFRKVESGRAAKQFGHGLTREQLPCIAIGPTLDLEGAVRSGVRLPTKTFSGRTQFRVGDVDIVLIETPGETHDQLAVWLPEEKLVMPGDNYYAAFPNLYTIRGTSNRPVMAWVDSLDRLRALDPAIMVPSHTAPVKGTSEVRATLTHYRDAIQFVHDEVVRRANRGEHVDTIAAELRLPPHLAARPELTPLYGELSWSARGIYGGALGWFDGEPEALYPLDPVQAAKLDVELIGREKLLARSNKALELNQPETALHLIRKLARAQDTSPEVTNLRARALRAQAAVTPNTNGRAFLLVSAREVQSGERTVARRVHVDPEMLQSIPLEVFFRSMPSRLKVAGSLDVTETLKFVLTHPGDGDRIFFLTLRRGVVEVQDGPNPLPGTPDPIATLTLPASVWRQLALDIGSPLGSLLAGDLDVSGDVIALGKFLSRFERGF